MRRLSLHPELDRGLLEEGRPLPRRVEVERVDVEGVAAASEQVHLEDVVGEVPGQAADPVAAIAERHHHLVLADLGRDLFGWARRQDGRRRVGRDRIARESVRERRFGSELRFGRGRRSG